MCFEALAIRSPIQETEMVVEFLSLRSFTASGNCTLSAATAHASAMP
jgi:hypothetical protein